MVTFHDLHNADLSSLDSLATDFEQMVRSWDLSTSLDNSVLGPLQGSGWTGDAANAAADHIKNIRTQLDAAFDEASAMARALRDAHTEFAAAQQDLTNALHSATDHSMTVDDDGNVHWQSKTNPDDPQATSQLKSLQQAADGIKQSIDAAVARATEADNAAAAALAGDTGTNTTSFNSTPIGGIPEEEAQQAADLLRQGGNITDAQLTQLDRLLKAHSGDQRFATAFYTSLGPEGFLKSLGAVDQGPVNAKRTDMLTSLQSDLGLTLATATSTKSQPHLSDDWEAGLRAAGAKQYDVTTAPPSGGRPYGYQILSNVLRTGNYDAHFLDPIAEHVTQLTQADPGRWDHALYLSGLTHQDGIGFGDGGYNPMSGVLEALGHSPDAATAFFSNKATLYNPDGTVKSTGADNNYLALLTNAKGNPILQDTLLSKNDAHNGVAPDEATALGHALEAATTGVPWDSSATDLPQHTPQTSAVMSAVVNTFGAGDGPKLLHGAGAPFANINGSLGNMMAAYIGDIQTAVNGGGMAPMATFGVPANLNDGNTYKLLATLGRDPDAYASIVQAQQAYTTAQIQDVLQHRSDHHELAAAISNAARPGGAVEGIINSARANEIMTNQQVHDAAFNAKVDQHAQWATKIWGLTGGKAVDKIPVAGGYANDQVGKIIQNVANSYKIDTSGQSTDQAIASMLGGSTGSSASQAVYAAATGMNLSPTDLADLSNSAVAGAQDGFSRGSLIFDGGVNAGASTGVKG
ncbi:hypothetical protein E6W39_17570 [Kitasatospora acidiphila]|uniref:Uncharacterized protein n=1 Tax=Kitasatospora acidiphila TaxID=2567942 RepID=A0A540W3V7_9ACTN|nr:DUF6571 family protein [Kitasatospora acidiphila]TQF03709.1 hypothetical protein E6W39_17570 [Kitasatospora acidiphila]